jgi:hypothetical protein
VIELGRTLLPGLVLLTMAAAPAPEPARWYAIASAEGAPIGHSSREVEDREDGRDIVETRELSLEEGDAPSLRISERTVFRQDPAGRIVSISDYTQTGRTWARNEIRIASGVAEVVRQTPAERRTLRVGLPPEVRFDNGEALLAGWDPARTPRLEYDSFDPDALTVEHVVVEPAPPAAPAPDGTRRVLRKRYDKGELRSLVLLTLDRGGRVIASEQPMFGTSIVTRLTDRETALQPHRPYSLLRAAMVKAPFRISSSALQGHIRYRFGFRPGFAFPIPATGEQSQDAGADGVNVDICTRCGPGLRSDAAYLADARRPTSWLQSDDPRLIAIASPVARLKISDARKMELLREKARPYLLVVDFVGHFSALETLSRRRGDCTEAAVLLAALGRAAGIPTRVASGLVYSRERYHGTSNMFMPHSWTLAWVDCEWRSFDLALDTFDSTHIALTIGDGDARSILAANQLAGLLQWNGMTEIRTRPAP